MSSQDHPTWGVKNAKKKALNNAVKNVKLACKNNVWLLEKTSTKCQQHNKANSQCDVAQDEPQWGSQPWSKPKPIKEQHHYVSPIADEDKVATKHQSPDVPGSQQEPQWGSQPWPKPGRARKHCCTSPVESEDEAKAMKHKCSQLDIKKSSGCHTTHQLKSIKKDQLIPSFTLTSKAKTPAVNKQSAHTHKQATKTPMWANDLIVSESEESYNSDELAPKSNTSTFINASTLHLMHADTMKVKSEGYLSDTKHKSDASSAIGSELSSHHSRYSKSSPKLVLTDHRKAAHDHGTTSIKMKIKNNDVEAHVPLFCGDLKDNACSQVATYLHLGSDSITSAKAFIENHSYHYFMHFSDNDVLKPGHYFNGPKLVGTVFAWKFVNIMKHKANRSKVPIPMVTLTSTLAHGSPPTFNFMGNQFNEVYVFHVQFLEDMKMNAPHKFHKIMADIFAAIQDLMHTKKMTADLKVNTLAFLDLKGMDE
ncbi:hypothetical protein EDB19DRAFT_1837802 [Suillus lakei]|nr:hypothetical protein EDB19DRAFT_1837802 [Suillus lakei]